MTIEYTNNEHNTQDRYQSTSSVTTEHNIVTHFRQHNKEVPLPENTISLHISDHTVKKLCYHRTQYRDTFQTTQ